MKDPKKSPEMRAEFKKVAEKEAKKHSKTRLGFRDYTDPDLFHQFMVGAGFGYREAMESEEVESLRDAVKASLGWFALMNDEKDKSKWPAYVKICERALKKARKGGL